MDTIYHRRPPVSRLERLLNRLLLGHSRHASPQPRFDLVHAKDIEFRQA
jgi:hypothetical protein